MEVFYTFIQINTKFQYKSDKDPAVHSLNYQMSFWKTAQNAYLIKIEW